MQKPHIAIERKFRPEIEGLRVIAALLVAVYHIWFNKVSGGVDVFFVVSGFLMTTSIISTINRTGEFRFWPYITKLIKRLFPSVFFILAIVLATSYFLVPESIMDKTWKEVMASMLYYENWQLAFSNTDYLDSQQMKTPVEHFWAMSIQGQFYLIWFILFSCIVFILKKYKITNARTLINLVLGSVWLLSFIYSIYLTAVNQPFAYFMTFTRVWEFTLGGLLCINLSYIKVKPFLATIMGWIGLIGLFMTGALFDVSNMFPGYIALWPMTCAVLIIISGTQYTKFGVKRFLASPNMVQLGKLSFGVYLWHWILLSYYKYNIENTNPTVWVGLGIIILSFIFSYMMTKYIEQPIRSMKKTTDALRKISLLGIANIAMLTTLFFVHSYEKTEQMNATAKGGYPGALSVDLKDEHKVLDPIPSYANVFDDLPEAHLDNSNQGMKETAVKVGVYGTKKNYKATIAIVGSSHSEHWLGAAIKAAQLEDYRVLNLTRSATRFSKGYKKDSKQGIWNAGVLSYLKKADVDLIIAQATVSDDKREKIQEGMIGQLLEVKKLGIDVIAIRDNPRYTFNILESLEQDGVKQTIAKMNEEENQLDEQYWGKLQKTNNQLKLVDFTRYFKVDNQFQPIIGNIVVYRDFDHITNTYSESFGPILAKEIKGILKH